MNTRPITVTDNKGVVKDALLVICPKCEHNTFSIIVIDLHNHLQCMRCSESFCQGGCHHEENPSACKDDSCDQSHCAKCGSHMLGGYLPNGTVCESCTREEEDDHKNKSCRKCNSPIDENNFCTDETCPFSDNYQDSCPYCKSGLFNEKGECQKCGL